VADYSPTGAARYAAAGDPALNNEMVFLLHATSLASTVTLLDITGVARALLCHHLLAVYPVPDGRRALFSVHLFADFRLFAGGTTLAGVYQAPLIRSV
jgi:hypothetical protein